MSMTVFVPSGCAFNEDNTVLSWKIWSQTSLANKQMLLDNVQTFADLLPWQPGLPVPNLSNFHNPPSQKNTQQQNHC